MKKGAHIFLIHTIPNAKYYFKRSDKMFQGLRLGILHFSSKKNFGDAARIGSIYFAISCSNFVISYKNAKMGK